MNTTTSSAVARSAGVPAMGCPCCGSDEIRVFHRASGVPVNSVLLLPDRQEALDFPTGEIALGLCQGCDFIFNTAFDPTLLEYSHRYEPSQIHSPTFERWQRALAERLIERHDLRGNRLIEIGCGKGEFLGLLCELGGNQGIGFDPACSPGDYMLPGGGRVELVDDFYSEHYARQPSDFIICKMTLEHIQPAFEFVGMIRRALNAWPDTLVFFQVPDVRRILRETAFWDIYYEHCSYFAPGSLARLFERAGFTVEHLAGDYQGQYLMLEARPVDGPSTRAAPPAADDPEALNRLIDGFSTRLTLLRDRWRQRLLSDRRAGRRSVVWASGSKGVAFLTTLGLRDEIEFVVDINPARQGHYMAGTGQRIVAPAFLTEYRPDTVVIMNPIYRDEIAAELDRLGLAPELIAA